MKTCVMRTADPGTHSTITHDVGDVRVHSTISFGNTGCSATSASQQAKLGKIGGLLKNSRANDRIYWNKFYQYNRLTSSRPDAVSKQLDLSSRFFHSSTEHH